jgi:outer membrane receptor protein involved in Fe transport
VPIDAPFTITDNVSTTGFLAGVYAQDEWKVTHRFIINGGLRFDQMWQFGSANQLSPRISLLTVPVHEVPFRLRALLYAAGAGGGSSSQYRVVQRHHGCADESRTDPVLPERSHYFDVGLDQNIPFGCSKPAAKDCTDLDLGVDVYYKIAKDLIDNGNFGQALVLSAFNYAQGVVEGIEFSAKFHSGNFQAYDNLAVGREKATNVVSNEYLFDNTVPLEDLGGLTLRQYMSTRTGSTPITPRS